MSSAEAFVKDICENPDDDSPRLIFADWLDDNGDSDRAEFIRLQVQLGEIQRGNSLPDEYTSWDHFGLSRCPGVWHCADDSPERRDLAFRGRRLLDVHEGEWLAPLRGLLRGEWTWSRGFLEVVDADPVELADSAEELFGIHPIRRLILTRLRGKVDALAAIPENNCLTSLDLIFNDLDLKGLRQLTKCSHLDGVTELNLSVNGLRDSTIDFLCGEPFFQDLSLNLSCNPFTDSGRQRLRDHFGSRVCFERKRHPGRLFTFTTCPSSADAALPRINPDWIGTVYILTGWGSDHVQLSLEGLSHTDTLTVFDHAGVLIHIETRSRWEQQEAQRREDTEAWLKSLGYQPTAIHVKRFPGVYDFPKGWTDVFDDSETEPEDHAAAVAFMERWLADEGFRYGSYCGGWWFNRMSGEPIAP
jgi:uncharacterized protein (TIGR02996 family)